MRNCLFENRPLNCLFLQYFYIFRNPGIRVPALMGNKTSIKRYFWIVGSTKKENARQSLLPPIFLAFAAYLGMQSLYSTSASELSELSVTRIRCCREINGVFVDKQPFTKRIEVDGKQRYIIFGDPYLEVENVKQPSGIYTGNPRLLELRGPLLLTNEISDTIFRDAAPRALKVSSPPIFSVPLLVIIPSTLTTLIESNSISSFIWVVLVSMLIIAIYAIFILTETIFNNLNSIWKKYLEAAGCLLFLGLGVIVFIASSKEGIHLYIDNASNKELTICIDDSTRISVPACSYVNTIQTPGTHFFEVREQPSNKVLEKYSMLLNKESGESGRQKALIDCDYEPIYLYNILGNNHYEIKLEFYR